MRQTGKLKTSHISIFFFLLFFQSFFGLSFGQNADLDIVLDGQDDRKMAEIKDENGRKERHYLYFDGESVTGKVLLSSIKLSSLF